MLVHHDIKYQKRNIFVSQNGESDCNIVFNLIVIAIARLLAMIRSVRHVGGGDHMLDAIISVTGPNTPDR